MGLLQKVSEARKSAKIRRDMRRLAESDRHSRLKKIYDREYERQARKSVKGLARKKASSKYGYTKKEKRRNAINNLVKGVNEMGDMLGGKPSRKSSRRSSNSSRSNKKKKKNDPFDINIDGFDFF